VWTQWLPESIQNILTYRNHIYAFHTDSHVSEPRVSEPSQTNSDGGSSDLDDEVDKPLNLQPSEPTPLDPSELKMAAATWILKVKEGHKLPQSTMNSVLNDFTEFNRLLLQDLHSVVIQKIRSAGLDPDTVSGLSEVFDPNSLYGKPFTRTGGPVRTAEVLPREFLYGGKQDLDIFFNSYLLVSPPFPPPTHPRNLRPF